MGSLARVEESRAWPAASPSSDARRKNERRVRSAISRPCASPSIAARRYRPGTGHALLRVLRMASRSASSTEVVLRDGESFAIAGLIDNRVTQLVDKIPGLGNVPILGRLFQSRSTQKSTDELLVVITPHFVKPLSADEKAKLPENPVPFLPTVQEEKGKKGKKSKGAAATPPPAGQPEFVGPRGQQIPNQ